MERVQEKVVYLWLLEEKKVIYSEGHCPVELSSPSHRTSDKK